MSALSQHPTMSLGGFLEWEARQSTKYEFDGVRPVAMTGGTTPHGRIQRMPEPIP